MARKITQADGAAAVAMLDRERTTSQPAAPATSKRCQGAVKYGLAPHNAPPADFSRDRSKADGLSTMCRTCTSTYTKRWAAARKAAAGAITPAPEVIAYEAAQAAADQHAAALLRQGQAATAALADLEEPAAPRRRRGWRNGLPDALPAVESPGGQAALETAAKAAADARREAKRLADRQYQARRRAAAKASATA